MLSENQRAEKWLDKKKTEADEAAEKREGGGAGEAVGRAGAAVGGAEEVEDLLRTYRFIMEIQE